MKLLFSDRERERGAYKVQSKNGVHVDRRASIWIQDSPTITRGITTISLLPSEYNMSTLTGTSSLHLLVNFPPRFHG
jgi:hypothetical protein